MSDEIDKAIRQITEREAAVNNIIGQYNAIFDKAIQQAAEREAVFDKAIRQVAEREAAFDRATRQITEREAAVNNIIGQHNAIANLMRSPLTEVNKMTDLMRSPLIGISSMSGVDLTRGVFPLESEFRRSTGSPELQPKIHALESEIIKLKTEINDKVQTLQTQEADAKQKEAQIEELKKNLKDLEEKQNLTHLLNRVRDSAQKQLLESLEFRKQFVQEAPCSAYVLSIDIRRSTELMLKAREAKLFAAFILTLARRLRQVIFDNYGVFDKFTGDGILAFFPDFYSGPDAGFHAVAAATECYQVFADHYAHHRHCFISVLKDTGLGIGLDYGQVQIVQIGGEFTAVGTPVVYACRMGGANAGDTYLNQPAHEQLFSRYSAFCDFADSEIDIKHEGKTLAYQVKLNGKPYDPQLPDWDNPISELERQETQAAQ